MLFFWTVKGYLFPGVGTTHAWMSPHAVAQCQGYKRVYLYLQARQHFMTRLTTDTSSLCCLVLTLYRVKLSEGLASLFYDPTSCGMTLTRVRVILSILMVAPYILIYVEFNHQQMHFYQFKEHIKIYIKIHINIPPTCFGVRPSSGSLHWTWLKLYLC